MGRQILVLGFFVCAVSFSGEKLVLVGGGDVPSKAVEQFVKWAGGSKARILVAAWGNDTPENNFQYFKSLVQPYGVTSVALSPHRLEMPAKRVEFLEKLNWATALYFSGGDQVLIMEVIEKSELREIIQALASDSLVVGGTSAGASLMSETMITGEGDITKIAPGATQVAKGLGLLPDVVIDQHFVARQRQNRLFSILQDSKESLAVGIDESTAIAVEDRDTVEVFGAGFVSAFKRLEEANNFNVMLFPSGSHLSLKSLVARHKPF